MSMDGYYFVKFTVLKTHFQKHRDLTSACRKNAMYYLKQVFISGTF